MLVESSESRFPKKYHMAAIERRKDHWTFNDPASQFFFQPFHIAHVLSFLDIYEVIKTFSICSKHFYKAIQLTTCRKNSNGFKFYIRSMRNRKYYSVYDKQWLGASPIFSFSKIPKPYYALIHHIILDLELTWHPLRPLPKEEVNNALNEILLKQIKNFSNLTSLEIYIKRIPIHITVSLPKLEKLIIERCRISSAQKDEVHIHTTFPKLKKIVIENGKLNCSSLQPELKHIHCHSVLSDLFTHLPKLGHYHCVKFFSPKFSAFHFKGSDLFLRAKPKINNLHGKHFPTVKRITLLFKRTQNFDLLVFLFSFPNVQFVFCGKSWRKYYGKNCGKVALFPNLLPRIREDFKLQMM